MTEKVKLEGFGGRSERTFSIRPGTAAREFESALDGKTLHEEWGKHSMTALAVVLWIGLKHEDDRLTVARVVTAIDEWVEGGKDLADLREAASKALILSGLFGKDMQEKYQGKAAALAAQ